MAAAGGRDEGLGLGLAAACLDAELEVTHLAAVLQRAVRAPRARDPAVGARVVEPDALRGEVGELVIRGPQVMKGYWPDAGNGLTDDGWLHTGDIGFMDEDGYFYLIDRAKDMYITGGENVYPAEIERVLRKYPGVDDIAVVGAPDETWGEVGYAFVISKPGADLTATEIINFCDGRLARYKWPRRVFFSKDFPRTALGKVRKTVLKQDYIARNSIEISPSG